MKKSIFLIVLSSLMIFQVAIGQTGDIKISYFIKGKDVTNLPYIVLCNDSCVEITITTSGGTPPFIYRWHNGDVTDTPSTKYCPPKKTPFYDYFNVMIEDANHHSMSSGKFLKLYNYLPPTQAICLVSVDSTSNKNIIIWEQNLDTIVKFYNVYKETSITDEYALIASIPKGEMSVFIDSKSNPAKKADKYIVKGANNCRETDLSKPHKPIHLMISGFQGNWNLAWSAYEGYNGEAGRCRIWRGATYYNMELIDSASSSVTSYTDINPPVGVVYYAIEVIPKNKCNPTVKSAKGSYSTSLSNIVNNKAILGINETTELQNITLSPNPCTDELTINVSHLPNVKHLITIYDIHGTAIYQSSTNQSNITINTRSFPTGLYLTRIQSPNSTTTRKFLKF